MTKTSPGSCPSWSSQSRETDLSQDSVSSEWTMLGGGYRQRGHGWSSGSSGSTEAVPGTVQRSGKVLEEVKSNLRPK